MSSGAGESVLFGRYGREECGLPPAGVRPWRGGIGVWRVILLVLATAAVAWAAGNGVARWRGLQLQLLTGSVAAARPEAIPALMEQGRVWARALPGSNAARRSLAYACQAAAERSSRRLGYYANSAALLAGRHPASAADPLEAFVWELAAGSAFMEMGFFRDAFAGLDKARAALESIPESEERRGLRLLLVNARAYLLASASRERGGDAQKALELATLMIASRDSLPGGGFASGEAAFVDTLAMAWRANGEAARAESTQRLALGLAGSTGLDAYVRHYDTFCAKDNDNNGK